MHWKVYRFKLPKGPSPQAGFTTHGGHPWKEKQIFQGWDRTKLVKGGGKNSALSENPKVEKR